MPPPAILDPTTLNCAQPIADAERIRACIPHRHEFALLDGLIHFDRATQTFAGYHDVRPDAWWTKAHIPGRPIFPGVLMIEVGAQLSSVVYRMLVGGDRFLGLVGVQGVKYRGSVEPPCRYIVVGRGYELRTRRIHTELQGFVNGTMVFEGQIIGMPI